MQEQSEVQEARLRQVEGVVRQIYEGQTTYARALNEQSVWLQRLAKRQDTVEQRLDKVEQRLDGMDLRLQSVEARLESLETQSGKTLELLTLALDDLSFIKQILKPGE